MPLSERIRNLRLTIEDLKNTDCACFIPKYKTELNKLLAIQKKYRLQKLNHENKNENQRKNII